MIAMFLVLQTVNIWSWLYIVVLSMFDIFFFLYGTLKKGETLFIIRRDKTP